MVWGQQLEHLFVLDLEEHCSYPVHARLQPAKGAHTRGGHADLLDKALAVDHRPDIGIFVGDGHYGCAPMVEGLWARSLELVSKLRRNPVLWMPYTGPMPVVLIAPASPSCLPSTCRRRAGDCTMCSFTTSPSSALLRVVFVLDINADLEEARPVTFFGTASEMAPEQVYRIYRDRFQIKFNFRDAKQYLRLAACQGCTEACHHFHVNAVLAALSVWHGQM